MRSDYRTTRRVTLVLAVICLGAAALRFLALDYGLPATYNPDETPILNRALAFAKGDLNPHNFLYPSLYLYALFAWEGLFYVTGRVAGLYASLDAFQREFFTDPSRLFLAGRALTAVFGIATVPALYLYGRRLYGRGAGLVAAAFLAVAPLAVRDAHYVKLDVPVVLFVVLTHAALALIVTSESAARSARAWIAAGLFAGLAVSTHYYVGMIVVPVIVVAGVRAVTTREWLGPLRLLVVAGVAAIVGFLIGTPFLPLEPQIAIRDIVAVREIDIDRAVVGGGPFSSAITYASLLFSDTIGWPVCLLGTVGFAWAIVEDWRRGLLLVSFTAAFLAFVANTVPMTRYLNVVMPMFALAGAFAVARVAGFFDRRAVVAGVGITALAIVPGLILSIRTDLFLMEKDTRTLAQEYVESHIPPGSSFLVQPYGAPLVQSRDALVEALRANLGSESRASVKFQLRLRLSPYPAPAYRQIYLGDGGEDADKIYVSPKEITAATGLQPLRALGIGYVVMKRGNVENLVFRALDAALAREGRKIAAFDPYRSDASPAERLATAPFHHNTAARLEHALARPGPLVEIWAIN
jgi:hypothetical protein